jgi:integrase
MTQNVAPNATKREKLTELRVEKLKPNAKGRYYVMDTEIRGFGIVVFPSGQRTFVARFRTRGTRETSRVRRMRLGTYPEMTVADARERAKREIAARDFGGDPSATAKAAKFAPSLGKLFPEYLEHLRIAEKRKQRTVDEYLRQWKKHIAPTLASRKVTDVSGRDIAVLHGDTLADRPYLANRVLALLRAFFRWSERRRFRPTDSNPCRDVREFAEEQRERYLSGEELQQLGEALRTATEKGLPPGPNQAAANKRRAAKLRIINPPKRKPYKAARVKRARANPFAIAAIRFLVLTGWREQEALTLEWRVVDLDAQRVNLRDTKTRQSYRTLSAPSVAALRALPRMAGSPYVFPGRDPRKPLTDIKHVWDSVRHAAGLSDVRLHDLRHSFASHGASALYSLPVLSKLLGHKDIASTQRYAHLMEPELKMAANTITGGIEAKLDARPSRVRATSGGAGARVTKSA